MAGKSKSASQNYNELRALTKKLLKEGKKKQRKGQDESEQLFEDDPRAAQEQDFGRVRRNPTHLFSKNILSDL